MGEFLPALDRLALATAHLPGRSDGDESGAVWYAVAAGADGSVAVALGAVRDADVAAQMRRFLAGLDPADRSPAATLGCLDQAARTMPALVGSAALCLTLAPDGVLRWIAAGHAPPLVVGPDGAATWTEGRWKRSGIRAVRPPPRPRSRWLRVRRWCSAPAASRAPASRPTGTRIRW